MEEKIFVVNLAKGWKKAPYWKRAKKSIAWLRKFVAKQMKIKASDVKIDGWLNSEIWKRGISNPPRKIRVKVIKDEKGIRVELFEKPKKAIKAEKKAIEKAKKKVEKEKKEKKEEEKEEKKEAEEKAKTEKREEEKIEIEDDAKEAREKVKR